MNIPDTGEWNLVCRDTITKRMAGSETVKMRVPRCPECSGGEVVLMDKTFPKDKTCECIGTVSITIGSEVTIPDSAVVTFKAPVIKVQPGFSAPEGATVVMRQQP